jgi:hypothetical protein
MITLAIFIAIYLPQNVHAQTDVYTNLLRWNLDGNDVMLGYVRAREPFEYEYFYGCRASAIIQSTNAQDYRQETYSCGHLGEIGADVWLPYDPSESYLIEGWAEFDLPDIPTGGFYDGGGLADFQTLYEQGHSMWTNWNLSFFGTGNGQTVSFPTIILGYVYSFFDALATQRSGEATGLKVVEDVTEDLDCDRKLRRIKYQAVDSQGRSAGKVIYGEKFDSFTNLQCITQSDVDNPAFFMRSEGCGTFSGGRADHRYTDNKGRFTDRLQMACVGSSPECGVTFDRQHWHVCTPTSQLAVYNRRDVASLLTNVRKGKVEVNGKTRFTLGTFLCPNGTEQTSPCTP